ncbi:hypothetical protein Dsin_025210 [Dipteronia sinensis]|uniref:DUF8040 domain-containing protein n=1 Tax=Dipteronia sinensis TaxID=43782 RepID=A0AAD9ZVP1_9ROSI|nr:hypothetical protein Dsin_025210 [Dipteronia sinensis]
MDRRIFAVLCELLRGTGRLKNDGLVSVEEQVCMFLHTLAHHIKNRTIHNRLQRFGETEWNVGGIFQANEQERRGVRRVWTKEEEYALLSILDEIVASGGRDDCFKSVIYDMLNTSGFGWNDVRKCIEVDSDEASKSYVQHHKQVEGFRGKHFPLYERLANIFGKDRATGKVAQTPDQQAANFDEGDNFSNEFEIPANFSPMSMNQSQSDLNGNQATSQPSCRKILKSKSAYPIASSMNRFSEMMKETMAKTNEALKEFGQILATNKANEYERIAHKLQNIGIRRMDQVRIMKMFVQKPEIARIFKALDNDKDKRQFIMEILAGEFDD